MERMTFFSIFTSWESFFARSGPKAPGWTDLRKLWPGDWLACLGCNQRIGCDMDIPMLVLPKNLPLLVVAEGGGGFWICEAVGARDWRMEYVRCMMAVVVGVVCGVWFGEYSNVGIEVCKVEEKGQERESVIEALLCRMLS